jgi:hypothetical protein
MADIVFVAVILAFFGLCVLYMKACERIIGSAEETTADVPGEVTS